MKKIIPIVIFISIVITTVLFIINRKAIGGGVRWLFMYRLSLTILFETLFILCFGIAADYKKLPFVVKIIYFAATLLFAIVQFFLLYIAPLTGLLEPMSKGMSTSILITCAVQLLTLFTLFAAGNVFSKN
jgi:hypothetical protein